MGRPRAKADLMIAGEESWRKLWGMIDGLSDVERTVIFRFGAEMGKEAHWGRDKNLRDVLVHLYEWHELFLNFVRANQKGEKKPFLPEPYTWKNYGEMNVAIWEKHQTTSHDEAVKLVRRSHQEVMDVIEGFSDAELFTKQHFDWTGTSSLGQYAVSVTVAHDDWAMKKLKAHIKTLGQ